MLFGILKPALTPAGWLVLVLTSVAGLAVSRAQEQEAPEKTFRLEGSILDSTNGKGIAARLYIESEDGEFFLARSVGGAAVTYDKRRQTSTEVHTSLSADPFEADLPPGRYRLTAERGKEYTPVTIETFIGPDTPSNVTLAIRPWIDMNRLGWFSGETHVHRPIDELRTLVLCENLNVALPLTAWVSKAEDTPAANNRNEEPVPPAKLITVDDTHVIWPVNTEYEITSVGGERHVLGALFVLGHSEPLTLTAPPVGRIAIEARKQGALLDLDKHNWPWSMMIAPAVRVDLFELTNNHVWRTDFLFRDWFAEYAPDFMDIEMAEDGAGGFTERGWIDFGLKTWYALLNCGLDIKPSAGTASGVHPVPLGFGRVYVKLEGDFRYESWMNGLRDGRSFVTTGPMLVAKFNGQNPGARLKLERPGEIRVQGEALSLSPLKSVEIVVNGEVRHTINAENSSRPDGSIANTFDILVPVRTSSWIAVRTFEARVDGRPRFAHTGTAHVEIPGLPLVPKQAEAAYLLKRMQDEIKRNEDVLPRSAMSDFRRAERFYEEALERAE